MLKVYLAGEIHTNWRDEIIDECKKQNLDIQFSSPVTDHASSDDCGVEILGPGEVLGVWKVLFENEERFFTASAEEKTSVIILPEEYLEEKISKADPFIKHCFRSWLHLTRKFMMDSK